MSPPTRVRWKRESSLSTLVDVHFGQATTTEPEAETSSSNRWSHVLQTYSYMGMRAGYRRARRPGVQAIPAAGAGAASGLAGSPAWGSVAL